MLEVSTHNSSSPRFALSKCLFLVTCMLVGSSPPEDPIRCTASNNLSNCTITNAYGAFPDRSTCQAADVVYPTTEELVSIVALATKKKRKMKVATRFSHSIPKLVCPDGEQGLLISTKYLNHTLQINEASRTMKVESGVTLKQLIEEASKVGLALPYVPYWWGLTIGGIMGTGAHGSTLWGKGSSVHDYVVQLRIVTPAGHADGYAKVRTLDDHNQFQFNAAKVSLGVLGVISEVTLKLEPVFKRSITYLEKNDSDLAEQVNKFGKQHEFADLIWYPSQRKTIYRMDDRVPSDTPGNAWLDFPGFRSTSSAALAVLRLLEDADEATADADAKCISAKLTTSALKLLGYGFTNKGTGFTGFPIVGYHNRLQASGSCLDSPENALITACPWDNRIKSLFFHQTTFRIGLSKVNNFVRDVQKLVDLAPKSLCGIEMYNGILMRYVTSSSAYLGQEEDAVDFDITYYRSKNPLKPRLYEDILEEIEQLGVFKYGGLPHWGKNRNVAFHKAINKYEKAAEFIKVKEMYDPQGLFSSEWSDQVLGLKDGLMTFKEGCALEGLCICSRDSHCAPDKGYLCQQGKVYKDAKVCALATS
ncbi:putative L-gulonolactone oxidase 6 [Apium graveolens]|uniref:putative L-gulonolactone oxidase 6 n=1 Tax=Apium graveolens TaxID=4045 RepID=UPI003D78D762